MAKNYAVQGHLRSPILLRSKACDFLLVINTNLPLILDRFQVMADYISNLPYSVRSRFILTSTLEAIPFEYRHVIHDTPLKTTLFGLHFTCRMYRSIFNHFYVLGPQSSAADLGMFSMFGRTGAPQKEPP